MEYAVPGKQLMQSRKKKKAMFACPLMRKCGKLALKKENTSKYSEAFENMIYRLDIVGKSKIIAEGNYYINDRLSSGKTPE